jgi:hypothetical protein
MLLFTIPMPLFIAATFICYTDDVALEGLTLSYAFLPRSYIFTGETSSFGFETATFAVFS